ncbi:phage portal protein [Streptomyces albireticuli]|uniref:phage portal protein n=1 Tax=Streptomyces albireticuli TaxID=1940 RepID=UPI00147353E1|nr:phage portal protein [Streptomyces albireticuli]MCD9196211.1 phage portal protein [Streptomyces albireticuli]
MLDKYRRTHPKLVRVEQYLNGQHKPAFMPSIADPDLAHFRERSITNFCPLVVSAVSDNLFVDGFRPASGGGNLPAWATWEANNMHAVQSAVHFDALAYGEAYVRVIPGSDGFPEIEPLSPLSVTAVYKRPHDSFPQVCAVHSYEFVDGERRALIDLYDDRKVFRLISKKEVTGDAEDMPAAGEFELFDSFSHGLDFCPIVRFRNRATTSPYVPSLGEVEPIIPIQDRLNDIALETAVAMQYGAFRQRWATGIDLGPDKSNEWTEETARHPITGALSKMLFRNHQEAKHVKFSASRLVVSKDPDTKFGQFDATDITPYLSAYQSQIKYLATVAALPPHFVTGDMVNLSAEALMAAEASLQQKIEDRKRVFGNSWKLVFRIIMELWGPLGEGEPSPEEAIRDAVIVWRDCTPRSFPATVDALGKAVTMLQVPPQAAWQMIPGVTPDEIEQWDAWRRVWDQERDPSAQMARAFAKSATE